MLQIPEFTHRARTILVVDDQTRNLNFIADLLIGDYNVLTAISGHEALQQVRDCQQEIHLLLADFQMAGMTGMELAKEITRQLPNIKILLMSGFTGGMLILNESWQFLPKAFIPEQLRALVANILPLDIDSELLMSTTG